MTAEEIFTKLVTIAGGDSVLVTDALRRAKHEPGKPPLLEDVVDYIVRARRKVTEVICL